MSPERYTLGYDDAALAFVGRRTLQSHGAFFIVLRNQLERWTKRREMSETVLARISRLRGSGGGVSTS